MAGAIIAALAEVLRDTAPLLAAPLVIGPAGLLYVFLAKRFGSDTARALIARVASLRR